MSTESVESVQTNNSYIQEHDNVLLIACFGTKTEDLLIDFETLAQPEVVTRILHNGLTLPDYKKLSEREIWAWSLAKRLKYLLDIVQESLCSSLQFTHHCCAEECAEQLEFDLPLNEFSHLVVKEIITLNIEGQELQLRLPTGQDQQLWLRCPKLPVTELIQSLVLSVDKKIPGQNWELPESWVTQISAALEITDPLMTLRLDLLCPLCAFNDKVDLDLETQLVERLKLAQKTLLLDIHTIASAYHWSEEQIVTLSPQRRQFYIKQIRAELHEGAEI